MWHQKHNWQMKKVDKWEFVKIFKSCFKDHYHKSEHTTHRMGEIICKSHSDKKLVSRRYSFIPTRMAKIK